MEYREEINGSTQEKTVFFLDSRVLRRARLNVADGNANIVVVVVAVALAVLVVALRLLLKGKSYS